MPWALHRYNPDSSDGGRATMAVNVTPLHDRVLVKRIEEKETVKGGIIIPDTAKEKPQEGEVIAVGAGQIEKGEEENLAKISGAAKAATHKK